MPAEAPPEKGGALHPLRLRMAAAPKINARAHSILWGRASTRPPGKEARLAAPDAARHFAPRGRVRAVRAERVAPRAAEKRRHLPNLILGAPG